MFNERYAYGTNGNLTQHTDSIEDIRRSLNAWADWCIDSCQTFSNFTLVNTETENKLEAVCHWGDVSTNSLVAIDRFLRDDFKRERDLTESIENAKDVCTRVNHFIKCSNKSHFIDDPHSMDKFYV